MTAQQALQGVLRQDTSVFKADILLKFSLCTIIIFCTFLLEYIIFMNLNFSAMKQKLDDFLLHFDPVKVSECVLQSKASMTNANLFEPSA